MDTTLKNTENTSGVSNGKDLPDNPQDKAKLEPETAIIDLPDVKDIPGQEFIHPAPMGEMADATIASDDEEGKLFYEGKSKLDKAQKTCTLLLKEQSKI